MATADSVKNALNAIVSKANAKTGGSDKTVAAAADRLISGYNPNGITPTGTKNITTNGSHDVTAFATAQVNVPTGITPSGTKTISTNGEHDVTNYAKALVEVPSSGITPSGTKNITENGTYDVASFASALVNVPQTPKTMEVHTVEIASTLGNGTNSNVAILSGNDFVKNHYADNGFAAILMPVTQFAGETNILHFLYHGNANIGSTNAARQGFFIYSSSASAVNMVANNAAISGTAYNISLRARNTGNINLYCASNRIVKPGTYMLVLICTD